MTPYEHNRTFCVCNGKETGEVAFKITVYDLEDVLSPEEAKKERARQGLKPIKEANAGGNRTKSK